MQEDEKSATAKLVKVIGEIIKKYRVKQNKTIYKISAECSINKESWRLIENGRVKNIKISSLWRIAEGLGISPIDILNEAKENLGDDFTISGLNY